MTTWINRLKCQVASAPGTGDIIVGAASTADYQTFGAAHDGLTFDVTVSQPGAWEVVRCSYTHSTTTLNRSSGTLLSSSTGSAVSFGADATVSVAMHADWLADIETRAGVVVASATGLPTADSAAWAAAIAAAGVGGTILVRPKQTYVLAKEVVLQSGQTLLGNGSTLKLADQVSSALTSPVTIDAATANVTVSFPVASSSQFFVGQRVAVSDLTVGGQRTATRVTAEVTAVAAGLVTARFDNSAGDQISSTTNLSTWIETGAVSYTAPVGAILCSISGLMTVGSGADGVRIRELSFDGNASNNPLARRWETSPCLNFRGTSGVLKSINVRDATSDAIYHGGLELEVDSLRIDKPCGMGVHLGATTGTTGAMRTILRNFWIDSPGMGDPTIGHYGGYNSSHPAYPALGCSRLTDRVICQGGHITNDYGTPSTYGTAISSITAGDNWAVQFDDIHISGFNKGLGPLLLVRSGGSGGYTSTPTDPPGDYKQAASAIIFSRTRFDSCYPPTFATADQWQMCCVGSNSGQFPQFVRVKFIDCEWIDSPMVIQESHVEFSGVNEFVATSVTLSSTLTVNGSTADVDITGCVFRRPVTTSGNVGSVPGWYQYSCNLYIPGGKVRGSGVSIIGGHLGVRIQNGAEVDLVGALLHNQYQIGIVAMSASTQVRLRALKATLQSGFSADSGWAALHLNSGGGALGAGGRAVMIGCEVDAVTTAAGQSAVKLPALGTAFANIIGCKLRVSGTSTTAVASGGAAGIGVVANNLLSHAFVPGAAETNTGNVVSVNV